MHDFYETLGVAKDADENEIKRAYRAKSKKEHPDAGGSEDRFHALQVAYDVLKDSETRAHYDATGEAPRDQANSPDAIPVQLLNQMMQAVIENEDAEHEDIVAAMQQAIDSQKTDIAKNKKQVEKAKSRIETIRKRLSTRRKDSPGHLLRILDEKIEGLSRQIKHFDEHVDHLTRAEGLLEDYCFEPVERMPSDLPRQYGWTEVDPSALQGARFFFTR